MRPIDGDGLKDAMQRSDLIPKFAENGRAVTDKIIDSASTIEAAPVVRCGECESWDKSISFMSAHACKFWSSNRKSPRYTQEQDYCSFGAKMDKEGKCE